MTTEKNTSSIDMDSLVERLVDADIPGHYATFTDEESAFLGAFEEDALSEESAMVGSYFNPDIIAEVEKEMWG